MGEIDTTMGDRVRNDDTGRYTDKYPREDVLGVIEATGGRATTSEVADSLDAARDTIYKKLQALEEEGDVTSRKAGGVRVWSIPQEAAE